MPEMAAVIKEMAELERRWVRGDETAEEYAGPQPGDEPRHLPGGAG
jgi:hypothetical protein